MYYIYIWQMILSYELRSSTYLIQFLTDQIPRLCLFNVIFCTNGLCFVRNENDYPFAVASSHLCERRIIHTRNLEYTYNWKKYSTIRHISGPSTAINRYV